MSKISSKILVAKNFTKYGVALACSFCLCMAPSSVRAQSPSAGIDETPLRIEMQGPICGKLQPAQAAVSIAPQKAAIVKQERGGSTSKPRTASTGNTGNTGNTGSTASATKPATVKEFSWLSDDPLADTQVTDAPEPAKATKISRPTKTTKMADVAPADDEPSEVPRTATTATGTKKQSRIDPETVKVAKKPHCSGVADYYADQFHGRKTASGQIHDKEKFTAAHRTLPFGTKLKVVNRNTGKACIVTVNDRGPFTKSRIIDLSAAAAKDLGLVSAKSRLVDCYIVDNE